MTDIPQPDWATELDRLGTFLDDIFLPMLAGWVIYIAKGLLIQWTAKLRPPVKDHEQATAQRMMSHGENKS